MVKLPLSRNTKSFLLITCVLLLAYSPILFQNVKRNPDAAVILPPLFEVTSPLHYFQMLSNFEVIDFQPVRDFTFFIDIFIYKLTGVVTFATSNVIYWIIGIWFLYQLLERIIPEERKKGLILWPLAFGVYPLFSQAVAWGMARKHVLAFALILWATIAFMKWSEKKGSLLKSYILYVMAALSHPIVTFWPAWAFLYGKGQERKKLSIFVVTAVALLFTNYAYYTIGNSTVQSVYGNARPDYSVIRLITNFFFYFRQIVFPYELTFFNIPDTPSLIIGIVAFLCLCALAYKQRKETQTLSWLCLLLLPFPIFLQLIVIYDQYLLIPAAAILIIMVQAFQKPSRVLSSALIILILGWGGLTHKEARAWTNLRVITERNYSNAPSCISAADYMMERYVGGEKATTELLDFFYRNNCLQGKGEFTSLSQQVNLILESLILYYEDSSFSIEQRVERLKELGLSNYYPSLVLAAYYSQQDQADLVEKISHDVFQKSGGIKLETGPLMETVLRPYCKSKNLEMCLRVTDMSTPQTPY